MLVMTASALIIPQSDLSVKTPALAQGACLLLTGDNPITYSVSINISDQMESGLERHRVPKLAQVSTNLTFFKNANYKCYLTIELKE